MRKIVLGLVGLFLLATASFADGYSFNDIQYWVGEGSNQAGLVIDWNDGIVDECLMWGYRFDGVKTGEDMLKAIAESDPWLSVYGTDWGGTLGFAVDRIAYSLLGHDKQFTIESSGSGYIYYYWSYYNSNGGAWEYAMTGATGRTLTNGVWDGWSFGDNPPAPDAPVPAPVTEPSSIAGGIIALTAVVLRLKRTNK